MTRFIKSLIGLGGSDDSPEEAEAYRVANEALQYRVRALTQNRGGDAALQPTTDRFGRAI